MLVAGWLPWSHGDYYTPIADKVRQITVLYEPYAIWVVPDYIPAEVGSIEDLLHAPALDRMDRLIQGMAPGAGISEMSPKAVEAYGLKEAGYHFENGTEDDCIERFITAYTEEKWIVMPFWRPQALHRRFNLRHLRDPKAVLGATDNATVLVFRESQALVGEQTLADLAKLYIGNPEIEVLDERIRARFSTKYTDCSAYRATVHKLHYRT